MSGVKSRREQYSEATRAALLETATALFAERGFAGTALEDVASATQVTRGAVYHHFAGKRDLFEAVLADLEMRAMERIATAAASATDAWESALLGLDAFLEQCSEPVYGRLVWQEGPVALGWRRWKECEEKYAYGLTEQFVRSLMASGYIEPTAPEVTVRFVFALLGAIGSLLADAGRAEKPRVRAECAVLIRRMLGGLRPPDAS
ncbi:TetR/AcrR family transcriptional regulator [Amycolatopsis anabasis]|uniref:TetR/AcrR family transcriptional regulator n=1 Tax=Amycolatopsis anabasis TaxID=1840409 RepID=UPI00131E0C59|nr:TetR/AcrR family transcriptional regulator [Amycolatopsis anabasis]